MTANQKDRTGWRWACLVALPVLCCAGHAVLVAVGAGSLVGVISDTTGRVALVALGVVAVPAALAAVLVRSRRTP